jgi:peptidoglycan hydrolase CwlO-like protein
MPRRVTLIVFLGFVAALILTTGISAGAAPGEIRSTEAEIAAAQERLMGIRTEQSAALAAYNAALDKMNDLNGQIADATEDLEASEVRLAGAQKSLEERASQVYKSGNVAFIDVMVGVNNFSEFAARMDLWLRLLAEEQAAFEAVLEAKNELAAHKAKLENQRAERVAAVEEALANKEEAASAEAEAEAYLASLNDELQAEIQASQEQRAQRYAQLAAEALEQQAPVEQQATAQPTAQATAEASQPAPEVAAVEETPVVPQIDIGVQQAAADEWVTAAQAAAEAAQLEAQQAADRRAAAEAAAAEAAAAEAAAAQRAAAQDARQEEREQARIAAERAAARQAEREQAELEAERAARRAEIEQAAAQQAAEERAAARRAAERQEELEAERAAARRAAERQEELEAERAARREERRAARQAEERKAERRAEDRRAARRDASASATATASSTASAPANASAAGGGASCGDDFGGVAPHVAQAGCDIQARFGLTVQGINGSPFHSDGLDLDIYTTDVALGNQVRDYAVANYDVEYTCWQDRYVNYVTGWREPCPGHMDHVHVTFLP